MDKFKYFLAFAAWSVAISAAEASTTRGLETAGLTNKIEAPADANHLLPGDVLLILAQGWREPKTQADRHPTVREVFEAHARPTPQALRVIMELRHIRKRRNNVEICSVEKRCVLLSDIEEIRVLRMEEERRELRWLSVLLPDMNSALEAAAELARAFETEDSYQRSWRANTELVQTHATGSARQELAILKPDTGPLVNYGGKPKIDFESLGVLDTLGGRKGIANSNKDFDFGGISLSGAEVGSALGSIGGVLGGLGDVLGVVGIVAVTPVVAIGGLGGGGVANLMFLLLLLCLGYFRRITK